MSETELSKSIREALGLLGYVVWRQQSGRVRVRGAIMHLSPEGTPDLIGYTPQGRLIALEVKAPKGKERPAQTAWLARAKSAGCLVGTVRSVGEAVALVNGRDRPVLPGWFCSGCLAFNGEAKEKRDICRACLERK